MRRISIFIIISVLVTTSVFAQNTYYIDSTKGGDLKDGLSPDGAWKTIGKVNLEFKNGAFSPGDSILFKRGESWDDAVLIIKSGGSAAGGYLTIGAYGTGIKPIFNNPDGGIKCRLLALIISE